MNRIEAMKYVNGLLDDDFIWLIKSGKSISTHFILSQIKSITDQFDAKKIVYKLGEPNGYSVEITIEFEEINNHKAIIRNDKIDSILKS